MSGDSKNSSGLGKTILAVFVPLITAIVTANIQVYLNRQESSDQHYRELVSKLADTKATERHAAAASIGTYLITDKRYLEETIDILTVRLSTEPNFNVRNSIIGSLKKIKNQDSVYLQIIDRLLTISRNNFIQKYNMEKALEDVQEDYATELDKLRLAEQDYETTSRDSDKLDLGLLNNQVAYKLSEIHKLQRELDELQFSIPIVSDMISIFLSEKKDKPFSKLDFFRTTLSSVVLTDLTFEHASIKWATFSSSNLTDSKLNNATISQTDFSNSILVNTQFTDNKFDTTLFVNSRLIGAQFSNGSMRDVFFIKADLTDAKFNGVQGMNPVYFYGAQNLDKATFDDPEFVSQVNALTITDFDTAVINSSLNSGDKKYLFETVDKL